MVPPSQKEGGKRNYRVLGAHTVDEEKLKPRTCGTKVGNGPALTIGGRKEEVQHTVGEHK